MFKYVSLYITNTIDILQILPFDNKFFILFIFVFCFAVIHSFAIKKTATNRMGIQKKYISLFLPQTQLLVLNNP